MEEHTSHRFLLLLLSSSSSLDLRLDLPNTKRWNSLSRRFHAIESIESEHNKTIVPTTRGPI